MKAKLLMVVVAGLLLGADDAANKKDQEKMQGAWEVVAFEVGGQKAPKETVEAARLQLTIKGNKFTYKAGDRMLREGTIEIDAGKKPPTIDVNSNDAAGKAEKTLGIYELKGDTMRVCFVPDGEKRPAEFATKEETKMALIEYKRVKK